MIVYNLNAFIEQIALPVAENKDVQSFILISYGSTSVYLKLEKKLVVAG